MGRLRDLIEAGDGGPKDECWRYPGGITPQGYGLVWIDTKQVLVHRYSYEFHIGPIPAGLTIDHLCRVRACWNPHHMEPVTRGDNVRRAKALITHCPQGHEYTPENTYNYPGRGGRHCKQCTQYRKRLYRSTIK